MRPSFHPQLVNDPYGDPALYIEFLFEKRALLIDLGEIRALSSRKIHRLTHVFISHTHMDHFIGFDHILRVCLGRDLCIHFFGPLGFIDRVEHKLAGYTWNLVQNYATDFTVVASEVDGRGFIATARFRCQNAFQREALYATPLSDGLLLDTISFRARTVQLDHKIPCLAFALEEKAHVNIWKNRLDAMGLSTGPWLRELKLALLRGEPDASPFRIWWKTQEGIHETWRPLGELKQKILRIVPGQKIVYVTDAVYSQANAQRIVELAQGADLLFIEARFLHEEAELAAEKFHLTARQAGDLAREAGVKQIVPFHFSARHAEKGTQFYDEAWQAFKGNAPYETRSFCHSG